MKYLQKRIEVEAIQLKNGIGNELDKLMGEHTSIKIDNNGKMYSYIPTFKGQQKIHEGYYIVKNKNNGCIFIMSEEDFNATYEKQ